MSEIICQVCCHHCHLQEGQTGLCKARTCKHGENVPTNYGRITSLSFDPIEKKPFVRYYPGTEIISIGSYGCSMLCPFCQNNIISMAKQDDIGWKYVSPEDMAQIVLSNPASLGLAFTYNEPLISFEYIIDCAKLLRPYGKKIVVVTNGMVTDKVWSQVLPWIDAVNIDLKGDRDFYAKELHGSYELVHNGIERAVRHCHVEVTSLIIPGKNDDPEWIHAEAKFLSSLDEELVWHLSRYFPRYKYDIPSTPKETLYTLQHEARKYLKYVTVGNI